MNQPARSDITRECRLSGAAARFAVIFKTYAWDDFIERRARDCQAATGAGDFFISVDESNGPVGPIPFPRVVPTTGADILSLGLPNRFESGALLWWNADYVHYQFRAQHPDYDYYVFIEYDAVVAGDIGAWVGEAAAARADFVALPIRIPKHQWFWTLFHQQTYGFDELEGALTCITLFSGRALDQLGQRRREMGERGCRFWPSSEAFVLTEVRRAGLRFRPLDEFGDANGYDWFPPMLEQDLPSKAALAFFHPVLDQRRYIASTLKSTKFLGSFINPRSAMRRRLQRFPRDAYMPLLPGAIVRRAKLNVADRLWRARLHLGMRGLISVAGARLRVARRRAAVGGETQAPADPAA